MALFDWLIGHCGRRVRGQGRHDTALGVRVGSLLLARSRESADRQVHRLHLMMASITPAHRLASISV